MNRYLLILIIVCSASDIFGQEPIPFNEYTAVKKENGIAVPKASKPVIDSSAAKHWPRLGEDVSISSNGKYVAYTIDNQPANSSTLILQSTLTSWKKDLVAVSPGAFSKDGNQYIYIKEDTLCIQTMDTDTIEKINGVTAFRQSTKGAWLAYQLANQPSTLITYNLLTKKELRFSNIQAYSFYKSREALIIKLTTRSGNSLQLVSLQDGKIKTIWASKNPKTQITNYTTDNSDEQISFMVNNTSNSDPELKNELWYYKTGMDGAILKIDKHSAGMEPHLTIQGAPRFSEDGRYIFFTLKTRPLPKPLPNAARLDVWHYRDTFLQSVQLKELAPITYDAVIGTNSSQVVRLQQDFESIVAAPLGDFLVVARNNMGDRFWLKQQDTNWLISLKDGTRKLIKTVGPCSFWFSPSGNYLVYYDAGQHNNYYSYNLRTGEVINISAKAPANEFAYVDQYQLPDTVMPRPVGIAGWLMDDAGLLVHANYDIWKLNLSGKPPRNITNGYGHSHSIKFRLTNDGRYLVKNSNDTLLLSAFNIKNKQNGFFRKILGNKNDPELLTMQNQVLFLSRNIYSINDLDFNAGMQPLKADNSNKWVMKKQSDTEAPNYYTTSDFKVFKALSGLQPQKSFNWLTAELVTFNQLDGSASQGVLYKPENFDSTKKYPVIFNYYEQLSHRLYQFPAPYFTRANPDVAWFVSRGYLVFTPDIYFTQNRSGRSAFNTVVGAARYLSKLPYVDGGKMAITGHSTAGGLTNYILTHTDIFAAAIEGAGVSDIVSSALQLSSGVSRMQTYDDNLWQNSKAVLNDESPIMHVNKVTTPLIIFHSKADSAVPWEQALELFIALRRLEKKCWLLQYDDGNHGLWSGNKDCEDYTIRITQFFDHYLKGMPPPKWMTQGIPAKLKGIETGYELDTSGRQP